MISMTLATSAGFSLVSGLVFAYIGYVMAHRHVEGQARYAVGAFALWWWGLAATTAFGAVSTMAAAWGVTDLPMVVTVTNVALTLLCVALAGLLYYLLYLFVGRVGIIWPLATFYLAYWAYLLYIVQAGQPTGVQVNRWSVTLTYAHPLTGTVTTIVILLLLLPQILGALAYFTLFFRTTDPTQRYRIGFVSWSIVLWFGSAFIGTDKGVAASDGWAVASRLIGLVAPIVILLAYHPPAFIKNRYHVLSLDDETSPDAGPFRRPAPAQPGS